MLQLIKKTGFSLSGHKDLKKNSLSGPGIGSLIQNAKKLDILYFSINDFPIFENMYGHEWVTRVENELSEILNREGLKKLKHQNFHIFTFNHGEFFILNPLEHTHSSTLEQLAYEIKVAIENALKSDQISKIGNTVTINSGYSVYNASHSDDSSWIGFLSAIGDARLEAQKKTDFGNLELGEEFLKVLKEKSITPLFQPIIDLQNQGILGWEALSRGPKNSPFHSPLTLFDMAENLGKLFPLEKICRELAITEFGQVLPHQKLFLNIHPRTIGDPNFSPGETIRLLNRCGLQPENIVFEITERHSVKDFKNFHQTMEHYRNQGYNIAIDDAGTGYSGLCTIAEIKPDYIKLDKSFIDNIDTNKVSRALIETFTDFANKIGARVIVEGIETKNQALAVTDMGVHLGQGYFFARPGNPRPSIREEALHIGAFSRIKTETNVCRLPVSTLVRKTDSVEYDTPVPLVQNIFDQTGPVSSVVVVNNSTPFGLVMDYNLNRHLSGKFGVALYSNRPITAVMDNKPLIVDHLSPVEQVSKQAMARERQKAYDDIIVTRNNELIGVVSVQKLLDTLAHAQVEMARGTNPLTGLPGNLDIEREVERRMKLDQRYSIIYADLDNFKVYNDTYGFKNGDKIILLIAKILEWGVCKHGCEDDFVGHIGGDDFVVITHPEKAERICQSITRCFKRAVKSSYNKEDASRGCMEGKGRDGKTARFPLVSVSLAILDCDQNLSLSHIAEQAASLKKWAKSIEGNCFVRERRKR
jgi:diguanylate cyclase (GGDEF)-like protein